MQLVVANAYPKMYENPFYDWNDDGTTPISGCTNPNAINYNPQATVDDGSCILKVMGCT